MLHAKDIFTEAAIDTAYIWLCKSRANFPPNTDSWHLRFHWSTIRKQLLQSLNDQNYTFLPLSAVTKANGKTIHLWSSQDALVLKVLATALPSALGLSTRCTHIKGHGGLKATVNAVQAALPAYDFVMKTDVKRYYESIDHTVLLEQLDSDITDPFVWRLLVQFIKRTVEYGGNFKSIKCGISRGCSLSPVIAAYYLKTLDEKMSADDRYFYVRYMDDIIVLAKSHWSLRRAVKSVNQSFNDLKLEQAPDKTFIGKIERGFDFLGYRFSRDLIGLAQKTIQNVIRQTHPLYEQKKTAPLNIKDTVNLGSYWRRWCGWAKGGLTYESQQSINLLINEITVSYPPTQSTLT